MLYPPRLLPANMTQTIPPAAINTIELSVFTDALDLAFNVFTDGKGVEEAESAAKVIGAAIVYAETGFAPEKADAFYAEFERHAASGGTWQADYGPRIAAMLNRFAETKGGGYRQAAAAGQPVAEQVVRALPVQLAAGVLAAAEAAYKP